MQVLVVEDDEGIRDSVAELLELSGFRVATVGDGMEALRWLSVNGGECAMVLDLLMPVMTGIDVLESLRETRPDVVKRTVVVSASPDLLRDVAAFGVSGTLTKPFELPDLVQAVRRACSG